MTLNMNAVKGIFGGTVLGIIFGVALNYAFNIPEVQMSHSTGECMKVVNFSESDKFTCDDLPSRYNHVWVK